MSYQSDVLEQPQVLHQLIHTYQHHTVWSLLSEYPQRSILLTGMGASYNALYPAWFYLNQQGKTALHLETSTLIHYLPTLLERPSLIVAASQSGESIELQKLVAQIEAQRHQSSQPPVLISVTNSPQNTLADHSDVALPTAAGPEVGIATKTYTSSMLVLHFIARALAGQLYPQDFEYGDEIASQAQTFLQKRQTDISKAFNVLKASTYISIIGRGPALATANNAALMLKEGVRIPAEGYSGGQFRHGPREMIAPQIGSIVLTSPDTTLGINQRLAADIVEYGGPVVCIGQPTIGTTHIPLPEIEDIFLHPLLEILPIQRLVAQLADQQNMTPGEFRWSGKVVDQE
ncbi:SIS domain-containing protein [Acaryochloris marina]|uniref:Glutamine--fructose-6-phosphate aminotransferase [isomerizing] n=1 Tax=Acaryochloris marina (strain MBIC 11017) TaxID=329726 RepID=B0C338_ACAM1|nr:SIS domain-containing protein [Acaryochloris marina]ABW27385.1 glucosamine--fructose-6-phosphate aminotransferase, putative [Acaryochloris marina MBIC11017]BDM82126.1 glucosamine--fructose-6-phosphate aminotransferase [Acaryochloris marina MBIC10699]